MTIYRVMYSTYLPKNLNITIVLSRFIKLPLKFAKIKIISTINYLYFKQCTIVYYIIYE